MTAALKPKAPLPGKSDLPATHVSCDDCDAMEPLTLPLPADWECSWCLSPEGPHPVYEHHSPTPLGFRDDKNCHWPGILGQPDVWVYYAKEPTP